MFDGDTLNIISIKTKELKKEFAKIFNPLNTMFISKNDGYLEGGLIKDQWVLGRWTDKRSGYWSLSVLYVLTKIKIKNNT